MSLTFSPGGWIDLSVPIHPGMATWPDNRGVEITKDQCLAHGDVCSVSKLVLGAHSGTHTDGPNHFIRDSEGVDAMPLDLMVGRARVIEIEDPVQITRKEIESKQISAGDRLLFRTQNSRERFLETDEFKKDFVHIGECAAEWLAEKKVGLVGVDYLSVGGFEGNVIEVHRHLLGGGIWCVEGLNLADLPEGECEFLALPLRIEGCDAGLTRAIARPL